MSSSRAKGLKLKTDRYITQKTKAVGLYERRNYVQCFTASTLITQEPRANFLYSHVTVIP